MGPYSGGGDVDCTREFMTQCSSPRASTKLDLGLLTAIDLALHEVWQPAACSGPGFLWRSVHKDRQRRPRHVTLRITAKKRRKGE